MTLPPCGRCEAALVGVPPHHVWRNHGQLTSPARRLPRDHSMSSTLMSGFPSVETDQVTLANWRTAPYCKWAFQHVREIVPSADIPNAPGDIWKLVSEPKDFSSFRFEHSSKQYGIDQFLDETDTDGLVILHRG